jgi:hypothetical protein
MIALAGALDLDAMVALRDDIFRSTRRWLPHYSG